ncbi:xlrs1, partial [Symbiodinium pilosum]
AATVAAVGITVGNSPDCTGEGYSGLRIDVQASGRWNMVYDKQAMFGNYERGAQYATKAKGFVQDKPFFHSFDAVSGVSIVRLTLGWADICYQSSITLNNVQLVGMPCEMQGTTATTTEAKPSASPEHAFRWAHINPVLMPDWQQRKSLGREGSFHGWAHGAFTASEVTAKSAKRGVRFKATSDAVIMIGLSHGNSNDVYWDIDYSMYVYSPGRRLWSRMGPRGWWGNANLGTNRWSGGDNDIFEVRLNSERSRVEYLVNRRVLWTAPESAWFPMNIDSSVYRGSLYDLSWVCDGGCSEEPGYDKVFLATDAKRWGRGPGGPSGSDRPNGEGYTSGEYGVFMRQSLDGCKMLCNERYWCAGFGFKHTDSFGNIPDWQEGTCQLMSRLVETTSRVKNFDSYKKVGTWRSYGPNSACRIDDMDRSDDGVKTVERLKNVATLEDCKVICQNKDTCTGIEYGHAYSRGDVICELWYTEIRTSAGMPGVQCLVYDNKKGLFERIPGRGCGYGGRCAKNNANNLFIGKDGNYYDSATRDTALEVCGPVCEASEACGGFNYMEKTKRCLYRKSAKCHSVRDSGRDCYVRRATVPSDEQDTTTTTTEVFYNGCYRNEGRNRRNGHERGSMTMPKCTERAKKGGFLYFGMEWPQGYSAAGHAQCMLLDDIPNMAIANDRDCNVETWNKKGLGGGHRLAIYSTMKVCHSDKANAPHNANFRCQSNDRWSGWRSSNDCSSQITSQSDTWTWAWGRGVHFTQWAEIKLPYAMQLDSFDVYHWTGLRCWYNIQYDQGGSWRNACRVRGSWTGLESCKRFPSTGVQRLRIIKSYHTRCPDHWFRLTGVDAYGKSCQACSRTLLDVPEGQRSYNSVWGNNKKGTGHARSGLNSPQAWSAGSRSSNSWMTIDLQAKYFVAGVVTRGRANANQWVTSFVVQYSNNNRNFFNAPGGHGGNHDRNTQQQVMFLRPVSARYIRIVVKHWYSHPSMRAAVLVCNPMMPAVERGGRLTRSLSSSCTGYDMWRWSGDDGGLLWFNGDYVYYEGDWRIVRSVAGGSIRRDWNRGAGWHLESVHADPVSGQIYWLQNNQGGALSSYQTFEYVACLNAGLGQTSRARLSKRFPIHWYRVFIGDGEMVVLDRWSKWQIITLGCSGTLKVKELASYSGFWMRGCERGRQGGILENDGTSYYILHASSYVFRRAISGPARNQVTRLSGHLGDICSLAVDYKRNRWYYHRERGRYNEGVYSCPATFASAVLQVDEDLYDKIPDNGGTGMYAVPMPSHVYPVYLAWRPTFRISNFQTECPSGWKEFQRHCYRYMGWSNFRGAESHCNHYQSHIFMPESDAEYDWVDANVVHVNSWHWLGVIGSNSGGWTEDVLNVNRLDGKDPFQISSRLTARPSPGHTIDHRSRPCYIFHSRHDYWRYHWHVQHCHEGRYFICKMPLKAQPDSWFSLTEKGYTCGKTGYRDLGSELTISGCYAASKTDANCNGQGFHYYPLRLGKFGQCFCGTATDVRDDGTCISKSTDSVGNNAAYNHIYKYKFFEYHLAGNNYCVAANDRRAEGSENPAKTLGACQAACSSDGYCYGFEFYANSQHEGSKCWLFTGHKRGGNVIPVRAFFGGRYKDAVCYIKTPYYEDGCYNDYGIPGYKFSHFGYWYYHVRTSGGDASLAACAAQCDRARAACIGFHVWEDGNARHCYTYTQERSFHTTIQDGRAKAFVKCKSPTWHPNDQGVGWKHFSDDCQAHGQRLCSYEELCPAGKGREPVGGRQAQTDAWCPIVDKKAANFIRCGNVGAACQKLTEYGALVKQKWPLADTRPELKDAFACCEA